MEPRRIVESKYVYVILENMDAVCSGLGFRLGLGVCAGFKMHR